jgi:hypothetical protein
MISADDMDFSFINTLHYHQRTQRLEFRQTVASIFNNCFSVSSPALFVPPHTKSAGNRLRKHVRLPCIATDASFVVLIFLCC